MATIFVGAHVIGNFVNPESWTELLPNWYGHLFLIYSNDAIPSQNDLIIRGGQSEGQIFVQQNLTWGASADGVEYWSDQSNLGPDGESYYGTAAIQFYIIAGESANMQGIWQTINDLASQISNFNIEYARQSQNSNSLINTLLYAVGAEIPAIQTENGETYWYPGQNHYLSYDIWNPGNLSYTIRGAYIVDIYGNDIPNNDRLWALDGQEHYSSNLKGDFLIGFSGDDELHDGNRKDILEGGVGNDTFVLVDDNADDIIIIGQGSDIIQGGEENDRLVVRLSSFSGYFDEWAGLSELLALPILGGFSTETFVQGQAGFWVSAYGIDRIVRIDRPPLDELEETQLGYNEYWEDVEATNNWTFQNYFASLNGPYLSQNGGPISSPNISFEYYYDGKDLFIGIFIPNEKIAEVIIKDFVNGMFGIRLTAYTEVELQSMEGPPRTVGVLLDQDGIDYIWNNGTLIDLPKQPDPVVVTPPLGPPPGTSGNDTIRGTIDANVIQGLGGNDTIYGDAGNDRIAGNSGNDTLYGEADDDTLAGGTGGDIIDGGTGIDFASYASSAAGVTIDLQLGTATGGDATGDTLVNIENLRGSQHDDSLTGNADDNRIQGLGGDDSLYGSAGDDELFGGAGADLLDGGDGIDWAIYTDASAAIVLNMAGGGGSGDADGDVLVNIENVRGSNFGDHITGDSGNNHIVGIGGNDTLFGMLGNDVLNGGEGDDTLSGGAGDDDLTGGAGADDLYGNEGVDWVIYTASSAGVMVDLATGHGHGGDAESDQYESLENVRGSAFNDTITGNSEANRLVGLAGDDIIDGQGGNDFLQGGAGSNVLTGGAGRDVFILEVGATNRITDFDGGPTVGDRINIRGFGIASMSDLASHATDTSSGVTFDFGANGVLVLEGLSFASLAANDFIFT